MGNAIDLNFTPTEFQPLNGYELLPAGDYPVTITDIAAERTNDNTSGLLKITMKIAQGHANAGRTVFHRLNLWHVDPETKKKAYQQLTALCYAVGITEKLGNSNDLMNKNLIVTLNNNGTYNNVTTVKDTSGNAPGRGPLQAAAAPTTGGFGAPQAGGFPAPAGSVPGGFTPQTQAAPGANPFAQTAPAAPPPAPAPVAAPFPPPGWTPHPSAPGYFYQGQEVKSEAELRALQPPAAPPASPFAPQSTGSPFPGPGMVSPQTQGGFGGAPTGFTGGGQAPMPSGWPQS